jgi:hypothetical protein
MLKVKSFMNKEKRYAYNHIKYLGINRNGIIFGGMVRDEIIATHYKSLFDEHCETNKSIYKKFWNMNYHVETIKRTLIPNDMDIYFQNNEFAETFITALDNFAKSYNGNIRISNRLLYGFGENLIHKKIHLNLFIGKTMVYNGTILKLNVDVIINTSAEILEPPFNNGDFTCNLFVMSKKDEDYEIRLSKNTGTKLDRMSFVRKSNLQTKIMNDLISGNTEFIRTSMANDTEYVNGSRILKMLDKGMKITNLQFREVETTTADENCDICQMCIQTENSSGPFIELLTNKHSINTMHKPCFLRYLRIEVDRKNRNAETNAIECRCTRRNVFNFNNSYKYSSVF